MKWYKHKLPIDMRAPKQIKGLSKYMIVDVHDELGVRRCFNNPYIKLQSGSDDWYIGDERGEMVLTKACNIHNYWMVRNQKGQWLFFDEFMRDEYG